MYLGSMFLQTLFSYSDVQHTHTHTHTHTFLFTLVEKSTSERKVCSPLISLFRSLSNTLRAIQIPGWCLAPFLVLFLWSDLVTRSLKRVGAFTFTSSIHFSNENESTLSTGNLRNKDGASPDFRHRFIIDVANEFLY